jgi:UDP-N-acetylglucosamine--N-acetylmuramyl-(pentapeptide) pyrophosphoryl-undecaprenol N-acetylglucosamine transferase
MNQSRPSDKKYFIFAGGGTGGHIYPAIAVAQQLIEIAPEADIKFFCSNRPVDSQILSKTGFQFTTLDAKSPSPRPVKLLSFLVSLRKCYAISKSNIPAGSVVIATGGFVSVPVVLAARRLKIPIAIINVDIVPGKANKLLKRFAGNIFLQFEESHRYFGRTKAKMTTTGCPLRKNFLSPDAQNVYDDLGLDINKKTLLVTGASSGAVSINNAVAAILGDLDEFADTWQIVHLTGTANLRAVEDSYVGAKISYHLVDYYDEMQALYAACDLLIGRGGAVSIAEFTQSQRPVICMPYPYHKDNHQAKNAADLCQVGAAVIVEDTPNTPQQTQQALCKTLKELMASKEKLDAMRDAAKQTTPKNAAKTIAMIITNSN